MQTKRDWHSKFPAVFFELAELNREFECRWAQIQIEGYQALKALGSTYSEEQRAQLNKQFEEKAGALMEDIERKLVEIDRRNRPMPYNPLAFSYLELSRRDLDGQAYNFAALMHWFRHGESLPVAVAKDSAGDLSAYKRLTRTGEDVRRVLYRQAPIKSFQGDEVHRQLLELILCFQIEPLTAEELAECLDQYCACGKFHEVSAARKQFARLKRKLEAAASFAAQQGKEKGKSAPPESNERNRKD